MEPRQKVIATLELQRLQGSDVPLKHRLGTVEAGHAIATAASGAERKARSQPFLATGLLGDNLY